MVKFEHKKPYQIGSGFSKKLKKPWELHVRLLDFNQGLIGIHAEVEISRNYFQHIKSVRVPVVYEIESILKKHRIEYKLWHSYIKDYITNIIDNHQISIKEINSENVNFNEKLADGLFGSIHLGELKLSNNEKQTVIIKSLNDNTEEKQK